MIRLRKLVRAAAVLSGEQNALLYGCWHAGSSSRGSSSSTSNKPDEPASAGRGANRQRSDADALRYYAPKMGVFYGTASSGTKIFSPAARLKRHVSPGRLLDPDPSHVYVWYGSQWR